MTEKKSRKSSKNHTYHEINLTSTKNNKLSKNSSNNYFEDLNDELNTSIKSNTNRNTINITSRNLIQKQTFNIVNKNNDIVNNDRSKQERFHRDIRNKREIKNYLNKEHNKLME